MSFNTSDFVDNNQDSGIKQIVLEQIIEFAKQCQVDKVVLFGSRARGDFKVVSDIDLAVYGGNAIEFALLVDEETETLLKFDIIDMGGMVDPDLRLSIESEGVTIYEKV